MGHWLVLVFVPDRTVKRGAKSVLRFVERQMKPYGLYAKLPPHRYYFAAEEVEALAEEFGGSPDRLGELARLVQIEDSGIVGTTETIFARDVQYVKANAHGLYCMTTGNEDQLKWDWWTVGGIFHGDLTRAEISVEDYERTRELDDEQRLPLNLAPASAVWAMAEEGAFTDDKCVLLPNGRWLWTGNLAWYLRRYGRGHHVVAVDWHDA